MGGGARARADPRLTDDAPGARAAPRLRPAVADDVPAIAEIERLSFGDPWSRRTFEQLLGRAEVYVIVAGREEDEAGLAGYAVAWFVVGEGEVANIAVHPGCRGQGVGASLIDDVLREARQRETTAVFLEVRESNDPARRLYASRGFQQVGRRKRYYRHPVEDALLLRWVPDEPAA